MSHTESSFSGIGVKIKKMIQKNVGNQKQFKKKSTKREKNAEPVTRLNKNGWKKIGNKPVKEDPPFVNEFPIGKGEFPLLC